jgi:magnesium transporter
MKTIISNNITWIDIQEPKEKDLEELKEKFRLHPFIAKQFLPPIHRPKIEEYPDQLFMALHFPVFNPKDRQTKPIELDFIVTHNTLITSHQEEIPSLKIFFQDCQVQEYHQNQYFKNIGSLLFGLLDFMIDSCLPMLDHIAEHIEGIEKQVFKGREKEMLSEIALVKKDLIDFRRAIKPQRSVLEILEKKCLRLFGREIKPLAQEVIGSNIRVWNVLENHQELINAIEQTNNSLLSHKLSNIMKILTVISFITFPLSVIVGFFGMNVFDGIPLVRQNPYTWLIILVFMLFSAGIMFAYFKKKKWL